MRIEVLFLLFTASTSFAQSPTSSQLVNRPNEIRFVDPAKLSPELSPKNLDLARTATVLLWSQLGSFTGTVISDNGDVLTAFHGVLPCTRGATKLLIKKESYRGFEVDLDKIYRTQCGLVIRDGEATYLKAQVEIIGNSKFLIPTGNGVGPAESDDYARDILANGFKGYEASSDFAIFRVDALKGHKCLKLAEQDAKAGSSVWDISYPSYVRGDDQVNSDKQRFTLGHIIDRMSDISFTQSFMIAHGEDISKDPAGLWSALRASIDSEPGSSGGSVINDDGQIIGVIAQKLNGQDPNLKGTAIVPVSNILLNVATTLGKDKSKGIFDCNSDARPQNDDSATNQISSFLSRRMTSEEMRRLNEKALSSTPTNLDYLRNSSR